MNAHLSHPSADELAGYAARRSSAADVLRVSDHLAGCAACRADLARLRHPTPERRPGDFLDEPIHEIPDFDILAGEVDGTLPPPQREELAAELARSPAAREALADLAAFRDELAGLPPRHHHADNAPAARPGAAAAGNVVTPASWRWRKAAVRAAGLAALFVAFAIGAWMFTRPGQDPAGLLHDAGGRTAELGGLPPGLRAAVETAARTGQLPPMAPKPATGREVLAGQAARSQMTVISPVGLIVREPQPSLRWTPRQEATGYVVSISAVDDGSLVTSPLLPAAQTQWMPPVALPRDKTYQWQVEALRGETVIDRAPKPPAGEARFQVLDAGSNEELKALETHDAGFPLILGVAYWRAGLAAAADDQFRRLTHAHAESAVARRLEQRAAGPTGGFGTPASR